MAPSFGRASAQVRPPWRATIRRTLQGYLRDAGVARPDVEAAVLFALIDGISQHYVLDPQRYPLDAVTELRQSGLDVGLINKSTLNRVDEASLARIGKSRFVLVAEAQNVQTGLGARFGGWLLERGLHPRFARIGTHERGNGGAQEQMSQQGLDAASLVKAVRKLAG